MSRQNIPIISGWKTDLVFVPNSTAFGTITNASYQYMRIGDTIFVRGHFRCGTPGANEANIVLPAGLTIDLSKLNTTNNTSILGSYVVIEATTGAIFFTTGRGGVVYCDGTTLNRVVLAEAGSSSVFTNDNGNVIVPAASEAVSFFFEAPIYGWGVHY